MNHGPMLRIRVDTISPVLVRIERSGAVVINIKNCSFSGGLAGKIGRSIMTRLYSGRVLIEIKHETPTPAPLGIEPQYDSAIIP